MVITHSRYHKNLLFTSGFYVNNDTITRSEKNRSLYSPYFLTVKNTVKGRADWEVIRNVMKVDFRFKYRGRNPNRGLFPTGCEFQGGRGGVHQDCPMKVATSFDVYMTPKKHIAIIAGGRRF